MSVSKLSGLGVAEVSRAVEMANIGGGIFVILVPSCPVGSGKVGVIPDGTQYCAAKFGGNSINQEGIRRLLTEIGNRLAIQLFPEEFSQSAIKERLEPNVQPA
jgi:hypothetical protein